MSDHAPDPQIIEPCPNCGQLIDVTDLPPLSEVLCPACGADMLARKQFNNFTLVEKIGEGGMGAVFNATDLHLRRQVALKILKKAAGAGEDEWKKLEAEARLTATVHHPYVVKVFSFGEDHGQFYLAMELVEKGSLDDLMALQGRVAELQVLDVGIQIAQGLGAAHEVGLLHRDVKPGNILFSDAKTAKIVDFGLAVILDEAAQERGEIWGTPYYIAPEKLDHRPETFRSDIYSLGGTLFHAVAGRPPFEATTASMVALKHIKSQAVSLQAFAPEVSSETAYVVNRMLNKDPEDRYASYEELVGHLEYAKEKLVERIQKPHKKRERVQIESDKSRAVVGMVWLTVLVILFACGIAAFVFRDSIFGNPNRDGMSELIGQPPAVQKILRAIAAARTTLVDDRDPAAAAIAFSEAANAIGAPQPQKNWALANAGVAYLLADDSAQAQRVFDQVLVSANFSKHASDAELIEFFKFLGDHMANRGPVPPEAFENLDRNSFEAFAILAFAIKNWMLGEIDSAGPWLATFLAAEPGRNYQWINDLKPLVEPDVEEFYIYAALRDQAASAPTNQLVDILAEVDLARANLQPNGKIATAMESLAEAIRKKIGD